MKPLSDIFKLLASVNGYKSYYSEPSQWIMMSLIKLFFSQHVHVFHYN